MTELNVKTITQLLSVSTRDKSNDDYEKMQFYYHPDHLGSSSYITDFNPLNLNPYAYSYQSPIVLVDPNGKQAWAWGIWGWIGTDLAVPEPTDIVPHKWLGYAIGGAIAGVAIGINYMSKSSS